MTDTPTPPTPPTTPISDPRERGRALYEGMLNDIESQMRSAPPAERNRLIAKYMPIIGKQLDEAEVDDELEVMRKELDALNQEVRDALLNRTPGQSLADAFTQPPSDESQ